MLSCVSIVREDNQGTTAEGPQLKASNKSLNNAYHQLGLSKQCQSLTTRGH